MKKILFVLSAVVLVGMTSCKKCETCTKAGEADQIECREGSGPIYNAAFESDLNYWREQGYECN